MSSAPDKIAARRKVFLRRADLGDRPAVPRSGDVERERILGARHQPLGGVLARIRRVPTHANDSSSADC